MGKPVARLLLAVVTIAVILLPFTNIRVASSELDTEKTVFVAKYAVVEGPLNQVFTVYNVKPHFVAGNPRTSYNLDVWWDGKGVAAAYLPGVQYVEVVNDPSNSSNRIVYKYPMMIGLSGVVRGSYTEFNATIPGGYYYVLEWFKVKNVTLAFAGGLGQTSYSYTITITSNTTNTYEIAAQAWIQARVGISLGLKLMDFASASLDLASVEAGVSYTVKYVSRTTSGYTYSVTFTIPDLNKITVFYQVKAYGYYYYYEEYSGSGPIPESRVATADYTPLPQSSSDATSYETVILLVLNAAGRFEGYTPFTSIGNFPSMYDEYDVGLTTGILVYDY